MPIDDRLRQAFAPSGVLRMAINLGNPILAQATAGQPEPHGVSVDLARALAAHLELDLRLVVVDAAGKSVEAVEIGQADAGFFAIDPVRAKQLAFTDAYLHIEGCYLVRANSPVRKNDEVDAPGRSIVVGHGSAYDLFLTRAIRHAEIVRAPTSPSVVSIFEERALDVAAGVRQQLEADSAGRDDLRLLPDSFMVIRQAMGLPRTRGEEAARFLHGFVEEKKVSGFIADALVRHGVYGALIAPPSAA